jgi:hypothetical protein
VDAAAKAWREREAQPGSWTIEESARAALEAAAPYMLGAEAVKRERKRDLFTRLRRAILAARLKVTLDEELERETTPTQLALARMRLPPTR